MNNQGYLTNRDPLAAIELPACIEAERAILGAIILDNDLCGQAGELLTPEDFFLGAHRHIFRSMILISERGHCIDLIALSEDLRHAGKFQTIGGATYIASLIDGVPRTDNIEYYARLVMEKAMRRDIITTSYKIITSTMAEEEGLELVLGKAERSFTRIVRARAQTCPPIVYTFDELISSSVASSETLGFNIMRRELCLIAAVTNRGKSTLLRNSAIALATGTSFPPLVEARRPLKGLLIDFETSISRLRDDFDMMTSAMTPDKRALLSENLFITCEARIEDEPLSLSRHLTVVEHQAKSRQVDFLMIDTASAAFELRNENDNGEVAQAAFKPLLRLARNLNCGIVLAHHIGKAGSEEGKQSQKPYRARGASNWGCYPASVFTITSSSEDSQQVMLTCAKRKDGEGYETIMRLDRQTRWFSATDAQGATRRKTAREIVRSSVTRPMRKAEILKALESEEIPKRTIDDCLRRDVEEGFLISLKHAWYAPPDTKCGTSQVL